MPRVDGPPAAAGAFPLPSEIRDTDRVLLAAVSVQAIGAHMLVVRLEDGRAIRTGAAGAEAVRGFQQGLSIGSVRALLASRRGCAPEQIDLAPLLETLARTGIVRGLTRSQPPRSRTSWRDAFHARLLWAAIRGAPIALLLRIAYASHTPPNTAASGVIAANLMGLPALGLRPGHTAEVVAANQELLRRTYVDRLLLAALSPRRLGQWLRTWSAVEGLDEVRCALRARKPVVLCGFHTGSYSLLPFLLAAHGVPVTTLFHAGEGSLSVTQKRTRQLRDAGILDLEFAAAPFGVRRLAQCHADGRAALILPDVVAGGGDGSDTIDFLGAPLRLGAGVSWLMRRPGAAILPVSLVSERGQTHRATIHPLPLDAAAPPETQAYGVLESVVRSHPAQWTRWKDLHHLLIAKEPQSCRLPLPASLRPC